MAKFTTPIPQDKIGESFVWRDWFQRRSDKVFGTLAQQDANNVSITGGAISNIGLVGNNISNAHITDSYLDSTPIGLSIPSAGHFTSVILETPLAIAYGGTNGTATPTAGTVAYGTGTSYAFTLAGTTGQVLTSAAAGTPTWTTPLTHTTGALTANSVVVGNGAADIKTLDNVKVYSVDTVLPTTTAYGKVFYNLAGTTWAPDVGGGGRTYADKFSYFPAIGLTNRGTPLQQWQTYTQDYFSLGITDATLYNSHYNTWATDVEIPAGLTSSASPGGSWNTPAFSGGAPTDPYYTEIGGYAATLGVGTKGNYAEGIGITVKDSPLFGGSAVEARLTGFALAVQKDDPHNTWQSAGFVAGSTGTQQTTYAPRQAYSAWGGWQIGLDLSSGTYHEADIKFQNATITSNSTQLFINVAGSTVGSWSATGLGISGLLECTTFKWAGYAIASPDGTTTTFLRKDGTWATPPGTNTLTSTDYSYTGTGTGFTSSPTATVYYTRVGNIVVMRVPTLTGTSNATTFSITGGTANMRPTTDVQTTVVVEDNGVLKVGCVLISSTGTMTFYSDVAGSEFTNSGAKGVAACGISYTLI